MTVSLQEGPAPTRLPGEFTRRPLHPAVTLVVHQGGALLVRGEAGVPTLGDRSVHDFALGSTDVSDAEMPPPVINLPPSIIGGQVERS